jgi:mono/diheme cytochrome c family protein
MGEFQISMRFLTVFILSLAMAVAGFRASGAQNTTGDARRGHALARAWCTGCHRVDAETFGLFASDFAEVAKLPSTTALSLRVFLQTSHKDMPNFTLNRTEADDIIAYILSLRHK